MEIPVLPFALGAIGLTFALAILGWWVATRIEQRRRTARRLAEADKLRERRPGPGRTASRD